jgi:hypothetical protein
MKNFGGLELIQEFSLSVTLCSAAFQNRGWRDRLCIWANGGDPERRQRSRGSALSVGLARLSGHRRTSRGNARRDAVRSLASLDMVFEHDCEASAAGIADWANRRAAAAMEGSNDTTRNPWM